MYSCVGMSRVRSQNGSLHGVNAVVSSVRRGSSKMNRFCAQPKLLHREIGNAVGRHGDHTRGPPHPPHPRRGAGGPGCAPDVRHLEVKLLTGITGRSRKQTYHPMDHSHTTYIIGLRLWNKYGARRLSFPTFAGESLR